MTVLALIYWPPDLGLPIIYPNIQIGPPDTNPNAVAQLVKVSPDWGVGTVGQFLEAPLIVRAVDSSGVPVSGATITFNVGDGGGCIAPYDMSSLPLPPQLPVPVCTDGTVSVMTGYTGEAGAWFELGKYTKDNPIYYKMTTNPQENVTQALVNTLNVVSQNNIGLMGGYTVIARPDKPVRMTQIMDPVWGLLTTYAGFVAVAVQDRYNNPVSNVPVTFAVQQYQYLGGAAPDGALNMEVVSENNLGVGGCPWMPTLRDTSVCHAGYNLTSITDFKGATMGVILGNLSNTQYTMFVSNPELSGVTITVVSSYLMDQDKVCLGEVDDYIPLASDINGNILNAGPLGSNASFTVIPYEIHEIGCTWSGNGCELSCPGVYSSAALVDTATVNATRAAGTGSAGTPKHVGYATWTVPITLSATTPELEQYDISTVLDVPFTAPVSGSQPPQCVTPMISYLPTPHGSYPYYAVAISPVTVGPNPLILDSLSSTTADLNITYTILPPEYIANIAQVDLLSAPTGTTSWLPVMSFVGGLSGTSTVTLNKGSQLDATKNYSVQVVLNRGSQQEIKSDVVPFDIVKFLIQKPEAGLTFTSLDIINTYASTGWSFIDYLLNWIVISNPANPVDSGSVNFITSQNGTTTNFIPNPPSAIDGRNGKLSYTINVSIGGTVLDSVTITQDELDELRQEYVDITINGQIAPNLFPLPSRNQFCHSNNLVCSSAHFSYDELTVNDTYSWAIITPALLNGLEAVRNAYQEPMTITSGYRTPVHNKQVGGVVDSTHIQGLAVDVAATCPGWDQLAQDARNAGAWVEGYCDGKTHVHMDWGENAPGGPKTNCESTCP
jgi:hypothetical protein